MKSLFLVLLSLLITQTVAGTDWYTNTTTPTAGKWLVEVQVQCTSTPCQTRLLHLEDWKLVTDWCQQGNGTFTFEHTFTSHPYFFRAHNGELMVKYTTSTPPSDPITNCPLAYPYSVLIIAVLLAIVMATSPPNVIFTQ